MIERNIFREKARVAVRRNKANMKDMIKKAGTPLNVEYVDVRTLGWMQSIFDPDIFLVPSSEMEHPLLYRFERGKEHKVFRGDFATVPPTKADRIATAQEIADAKEYCLKNGWENGFTMALIRAVEERDRAFAAVPPARPSTIDDEVLKRRVTDIILDCSEDGKDHRVAAREVLTEVGKAIDALRRDNERWQQRYENSLAAPPSIPEREKVLEALKVGRYCANELMELGEAYLIERTKIESAIAELEGK